MKKGDNVSFRKNWEVPLVDQTKDLHFGCLHSLGDSGTEGPTGVSRRSLNRFDGKVTRMVKYRVIQDETYLLRTDTDK